MQVVFHVRAKRSFCTLCSSLGLDFVSREVGRASPWALSGMLLIMFQWRCPCQVMKPHFSALSLSSSGLRSEAPVSPGMLR